MDVETASLFEGISQETRRKILATAREESHAQGSFLFRQGDPARHFYILGEGRVRLSMGEKGLLAHVVSAPGDIIGWSSLAGNEAYRASAECRGPVNVLKFEKSQLDQTLSKDPVSGMVFFKHLAMLIGRRLVNSYQATLSMQGDREPRSYG